jgi:hypothetical protein
MVILWLVGRDAGGVAESLMPRSIRWPVGVDHAWRRLGQSRRSYRIEHIARIGRPPPL